MSGNFFTSIDLQKNELLNGVIHKSASAPLSPVQGQIYFNTTDSTMYVYDGSSWVSSNSQELTVHANSSQFLSIVDNELIFHNLAITGVTVDTTSSDIEAFVTASYTVGTEFQEGDMIILTNATDQSKRSYIHNGGTSVTSADFTRLQTDLDLATIKGSFVGGNGLSYTSATGTFDVNVDDSTIAIVGDNVVVKDGGITETQLASAVLSKINNTYKETFGDGASTSYTITHNLNSSDLQIEIYEISTGECMECNVVRTNVNTVTVGAFPAPALNNARIIIRRVD